MNRILPVVVASLFLSACGVIQGDRDRTSTSASASGVAWHDLVKGAAPLTAVPFPVVSQCSAVGGGKCHIRIHLEGGVCPPESNLVIIKQDVTIVWTIATPGWDFAADGIAFKNPEQAARGFDRVGHAAPQAYVWHSKQAAPRGQYDYAIHLVGPNGATCNLDPGLWI